MNLKKINFIITTLLFFIVSTNINAAEIFHLNGTVETTGIPISQSTVTLWAANSSEPIKLIETTTQDNGSFNLQIDSTQRQGDVFYLTAMGGHIQDKNFNNAIGLMTNIGHNLPQNVVINEHTTIASVWTGVQFMQGTGISGNLLGLKIAAGNVPNLVDLETGKLGPVILDSLNSSQTTTLARFNTLANLLAACINQIQDNACVRLFALTSSANNVPQNTLEAASVIARNPWKDAEKIYALYDDLYPLPVESGNTRQAPFLPYLDYAPKEWSLALVYAGGGLYAPGKLAIDANGNIWTGNNWMPGSQSSFYKNIPGGLTHLSANGVPLSPPISGYTGGGMQGVGYGTAVSEDSVWIGSFDGKAVATFDLNGQATSPVTGYNFDGKLGSLQGVMVAPNKDVWVVDTFKNQVIHFPKGNPANAQLISTLGLHAPFYLAIDHKNQIWVTNSGGNVVTRFSAENPLETQHFTVGYSPIGIAVDSQGNVWANNFIEDLPFYVKAIMYIDKIKSMFLSDEKNNGMIKLDSHEKFIESLDYAYTLSGKAPNGSVSMIKTDGTQYKFNPQSSIWGPWGIAVDGDDHIWVANFRNKTVVQLAGVQTDKAPQNVKTGDAIAIYADNGIQHITDIAIDPAGNVWVANNWDIGEIAFNKNPPDPLSTRAGGNGVVVIFGLAKPVRTPLIGPPRTP